MSERITIKDDGVGIARKSGTDKEGNVWIEFGVDVFAGESEGICQVCGATIESGWLCLDGGDEVCDEHVDFISEEA